MEDIRDDELFDLLPSELFNHPDCFRTATYRRWEREIATPALEAMGYSVSDWKNEDADSFGPLVRSVVLTKDGIEKRFFYG